MQLRTIARRCVPPCALAAALLLATGGAGAAQPPDTARARFDEGLAALHNFEYEDANEAFRAAQRLAPDFVLAYWGEALTYDQVLWRLEDPAAARTALARLGPTPAARAARAADARARGLLGAVEVLFGDGDSAARHARYVRAMAALAAAYPADPDIASLYALALLGTASRGLIVAPGGHDAHDRQLAGSETQTQVAVILQRALAADPRHPGALHYLLHDYDDPAHAALALDAARAYAPIASGSSHALHMPAHIFLQLGLWHDAAASDRAAFDASVARGERQGLDRIQRNYHALGWLQYELLQLGRYREAQDLIGEIDAAVRAASARPRADRDAHQPLLSNRSSMRARFAIETRRWEVMATETTFGNADDLFAIGLSAARTNHLDLAERSRQALAARIEAEQEGDLRPAIAVMEREVAGLIALAQGRRDDALGILNEAARAEAALPPPFGLPSPAKPAQELYGETLADAGRPREAAAQFERALKRYPNRSLSVLGMARAEAALGNVDAARRQYSALLASFDRADSDVADIVEARAALAAPDPAPQPPAASRLAAYGGAAAVLLIGLVITYRRSRRSRPRAPGVQAQQPRHETTKRRHGRARSR